MKYTAINIGPIIQTFTMARKPREFWAASYLFSYLMQQILKKFDKDSRLTLVSPCLKTEVLDKRVGLFPDRAFYRMNQELNVARLIQDEVIPLFADEVKLPQDVISRYFRIMVACAEYDFDHEAIAGLNDVLDCMELNQIAISPSDGEIIQEYLQKTTNNDPSPLFKIAFGTSLYPIETLEEIALAGSKEAAFSYQRYICIVQADGDNMGSIVKSEGIEGHLTDLSEKLMTFGVEACKEISSFKGLPIYAGGDDLLFIAPIHGSKGSIIDLITAIDSCYKKVQDYVDSLNIVRDGKIVHTSMSYGVSITYYKYPLYEAWKNAREQLFYVAKKNPGKNAISWKLQKHSGSDFHGVMNKDSEMFGKFKELVHAEQKETIVSSVAHKFRSNEVLLDLFPKVKPFVGLKSRLDAFYDKIIDAEANVAHADYLNITSDLFLFMYKELFEMNEFKKETEIKKEIKDVVAMMYNALRTAKFIKGEEVKE